MKRQIITIDEAKCNGCGLCVSACHEGAIGLENGKAKLLRDDYCDGLGDCLPACPTGAISFETREAEAYNEEAMRERANARANAHARSGSAPAAHSGCPGSAARSLARSGPADGTPQKGESGKAGFSRVTDSVSTSELRQWPVQLKLAPVNAPYFDGANLLVAADCTAFAYAAFHEDFIRNRIALIGCPKLDPGDYTEKLTAILAENDVKSLTIVRMEVPCCGGLANQATEALKASGKFIPWQVVTISIDGKIL
ncbi:MAG TPA: 4Fe-4S binding protein [Treponemataceae bacterium]|nr:4Fe-4S binding protein [Treponemataceae bacterium]HPS43754.1 4Fe-4S binding protein [Treponemataceae bacterium]